MVITMAYSMTGYGRGENECGDTVFRVEVKSVNHRYCDISIKMPKNMSYLENNMRQLALTYISRGKTDVFVALEESGADRWTIKLDESLADAYNAAFSQLKFRYNFSESVPLASFAQIPGDVRSIGKYV